MPEREPAARGRAVDLDSDESAESLWRRLGVWGGLAAFGLAAIVFSARSDAGSARIAALMGGAAVAAKPDVLPPTQIARVAAAVDRTLHFADALRRLETDRDKLTARLDALEKVQEVTGSIPARPAPPATAAAGTPTASASLSSAGLNSAGPRPTSAGQTSAASAAGPTSGPAAAAAGSPDPAPATTAAGRAVPAQSAPPTAGFPPIAPLEMTHGSRRPVAGAPAPPPLPLPADFGDGAGADSSGARASAAPAATDTAPSTQAAASSAREDRDGVRVATIRLTPPLPTPAPARTASNPASGDTEAASTPAPPPLGIDLGGDRRIYGLRTRWANLRRLHPGLLDGLRPMVVVREIKGGVEVRLVAGPVGDPVEAARLCAKLAPSPCSPARFEGQHLAAR